MIMMMVVMMTQQCKDVRAEQRVESPPDKLQLARAAQQPSHNEDGGQRKSSQSSSGLIISNKNCNKQRGCRSTLLWSSSSEKGISALHFIFIRTIFVHKTSNKSFDAKNTADYRWLWLLFYRWLWLVFYRSLWLVFYRLLWLVFNDFMFRVSQRLPRNCYKQITPALWQWKVRLILLEIAFWLISPHFDWYLNSTGNIEQWKFKRAPLLGVRI